MVEDAAVARQGVVARLESDDAAAGGPDADRASGTRPDRKPDDARGDGGRGPTAGSAGNARRRDGVHDAPDTGIVAGDAVGEFMQVREADNDRPGAPETRDDLGIARGGRALERLAAAGERHALDPHQSLIATGTPASIRPAHQGGGKEVKR